MLFFYCLLIVLCNIDCKIESSILNSNAHPTLSTVNPFIKYPAINTIIALIINRNKPKVIIVIGIVKSINIGRTNVFRNPSTIATIIAVV